MFELRQRTSTCQLQHVRERCSTTRVSACRRTHRCREIITTVYMCCWYPEQSFAQSDRARFKLNGLARTVNALRKKLIFSLRSLKDLSHRMFSVAGQCQLTQRT
jgi:hypothetical protein